MKCLVIQREKKIILISEYREEALLQDCKKYIVREGYEIIAPKAGETADLEKCLTEYGKQGYHLCRYVEMDMHLAGYQVPQMHVPEKVTFGFYEGEIEGLHHAVTAVEEDWVQYFDAGGRFYCGFANGEIASFCIVGYDEDCVIANDKARIGSVGCVGTVPKYRKQGIGLYMVALATWELKAAGCDKGFIHYTALEKWYGKLGYQSFLSFYM